MEQGKDAQEAKVLAIYNELLELYCSGIAALLLYCTEQTLSQLRSIAIPNDLELQFYKIYWYVIRTI